MFLILSSKSKLNLLLFSSLGIPLNELNENLEMIAKGESEPSGNLTSTDAITEKEFVRKTII